MVNFCSVTSSATVVDNIFTNCVFDTSLKNGIIRSSISDHFAIFAAIKLSNEQMKKLETKKKKLKRDFLVPRTRKVLNRISKK